MSKPVLGIIGGGQLGSMLVTAAKKIGLKTVIFCDDQDAPAHNFSDKFICGKYDDQNIIDEFINAIDIATFEFENIPYETLNKINNIKSVLPNPPSSVSLLSWTHNQDSTQIGQSVRLE